MRNANRIEEGITIMYNGLECVVIESWTKYVNLKVKATNQMFQGVRIIKNN